eukprot:scaffold98699_cov69-Phaeocystis_antarctica.AAC.2
MRPARDGRVGLGGAAVVGREHPDPEEGTLRRHELVHELGEPRRGDVRAQVLPEEHGAARVVAEPQRRHVDDVVEHRRAARRRELGVVGAHLGVPGASERGVGARHARRARRESEWRAGRRRALRPVAGAAGATATAAAGKGRAQPVARRAAAQQHARHLRARHEGDVELLEELARAVRHDLGVEVDGVASEGLGRADAAEIRRHHRARPRRVHAHLEVGRHSRRRRNVHHRLAQLARVLPEADVQLPAGAERGFGAVLDHVLGRRPV